MSESVTVILSLISNKYMKIFENNTLIVRQQQFMIQPPLWSPPLVHRTPFQILVSSLLSTKKVTRDSSRNQEERLEEEPGSSRNQVDAHQRNRMNVQFDFRVPEGKVSQIRQTIHVLRIFGYLKARSPNTINDSTHGKAQFITPPMKRSNAR